MAGIISNNALGRSMSTMSSTINNLNSKGQASIKSAATAKDSEPAAIDSEMAKLLIQQMQSQKMMQTMTTISNTLKTMHDAMMVAINNFRVS